jgi:hypothetical protein
MGLMVVPALFWHLSRDDAAIFDKNAPSVPRPKPKANCALCCRLVLPLQQPRIFWFCWGWCGAGLPLLSFFFNRWRREEKVRFNRRASLQPCGGSFPGTTAVLSSVVPSVCSKNKKATRKNQQKRPKQLRLRVARLCNDTDDEGALAKRTKCDCLLNGLDPFRQ